MGYNGEYTCNTHQHLILLKCITFCTSKMYVHLINTGYVYRTTCHDVYNYSLLICHAHGAWHDMQCVHPIELKVHDCLIYHCKMFPYTGAMSQPKRKVDEGTRPESENICLELYVGIMLVCVWYIATYIVKN